MTATTTRGCWSACLPALLLSALPGFAGCVEPGPAAAGPQAPQVQTQDVEALSEGGTVPEWKPGDPVRIVPDLRQDGQEAGAGAPSAPEPPPPPRPFVRKPVAPNVLDQNVNDLPKAEPGPEGGPARVVPDLKESDPQE